jgi:hypothetical protein
MRGLAMPKRCAAAWVMRRVCRMPAVSSSSIARRSVDRHQHDPQLLVGQHHAHRGQASRTGVLRGQRLQHLGVAGKRDARGRQRLLVDRRGHDRARPAGHGFLDCRLDAARCTGPGLGRDPAPWQRRQAGRQPLGLPDRQRPRGHRAQIRRGIDARHGPGQASHGERSAHHAHVGHDHGIGEFAGRPGFGDDLRPDAAGIAHGHQQRGQFTRLCSAHAGLSISMNSCAKPSASASRAPTAGAP